MRVRCVVPFVLLALPFAALPASAHCEVVSPEASPDINYTTVCVLDQGSVGDPYQTFTHEYLVHVSHAVEAGPAFDYAHAEADQGSWTYDDGETHQERRGTDVGAGAFEGVRGVFGTGFQAALDQRDQTAPEDGDGACSGVVGRSTCVGASGWFTVQDVASVGVGVYSQQTGTGAGCQETQQIYVDAAVAFIPVVTEPRPCTAEMSFLYDEVPFRALPVLP